jgi:Leucine-rich repeat (LRR) protein
MKQIALTFLVLLLNFNSFGQRDQIFKSIEDALTVPVDSVFRIDLSGNRLKTIPTALMQFKNLIELDLSRNKLTALPEDFLFPNIEVLNLTKNDFEVFPEAICSNTSLRQLLMGKNKLSTLPTCIGNLTDLVTLDIWFNQVIDLPESLTQLKKLKTIDFRGMNYNDDFQKKWIDLLPWVKLEFEIGCDCGY